MRRSRWLTALVVAVLAGVVLLPPSSSDAPPASTRDPEVRRSRCLPVGPLETVADLNRFVRRSPGVPELRGADLGLDALLGDGRRLWLFADTLQSGQSGATGPRIVRNSALLFDGRCVRVVTGPDGTAVVPDRADGVGYWPMSVLTVDLPRRTKVLVLAQRVRAVGTGQFDFATLGTSVAELGIADGRPPLLRSVTDLGPDRPSPRLPRWGAAVTRWQHRVYLYGTSTREIPGVHGFALRVARSRREHLTTPAHWEYWDGTGWTRAPARAATLVTERGGVSQTLSVFPARGRWWALSKQDEFLGTALAAWPAPTPWGPFGEPTKLLEIPCDLGTGELRYLALAHPGLLHRPGTVVVSWSRNNTDLAQVCADPGLYRPHFRRVRLGER